MTSKPKVREGRGDDLLAAVVSVLPHLGDEDARLAAVVLGEGRRQPPHALDRLAAPAACARIDTGHELRPGRVAPPGLFERGRDLADGRPGAGRLDRQIEEVGPAPRPLGQRPQRGPDGQGVTPGAQFGEPGDLGAADRAVVDPQGLERRLGQGPEAVDPDDGLLARVDPGLGAGRRLLDPPFGQAGLDGPGHAAQAFDLLDMAHGPRREVGGQAFHIGGAAPRVDVMRRSGLVLQHELRIAGDAGGKIGRQGQRLVERVRMKTIACPRRPPPWPRSSCG